MEIKKVCLQRQQMILKFLGYYTGKCDGIWSEKTIAAKRDFELSGKFHPAYPNNGMPFDPSSKLPSGIMLDFTKPRSGMLTHVDAPADYFEKLAIELVEVQETVDPNAIHAPIYDPLMNQSMNHSNVDRPVAKAEPVITSQLVDTSHHVKAEPVVAEVTEPVEEVKVEQRVQQNQNQQHKHHNRPR